VINKETIFYVATLAKIEIDDKEAEKLKNDFEKILEYFNILDEVPEDVEPTFHVLPLYNVLRDDIPKKSLSQEEVLANTRHKEDGFFKGPKIIE